MGIEERIEELGVSGCVACGKCTWACLVSRRPGDFSPRTLVERILKGEGNPLERNTWACTNCAMCTEVCDSGVRFHEFVRGLRSDMAGTIPPEMTHGGIVPSIRRLTSMPHIRPRGGSWVSDDLEIDPHSGTTLFVGCLPYFDVIFRDFRDDLLEIPRSAVRLLNAMGIRPSLLKEERCCGHDAYWMGEDRTLDDLARRNMDALESQGTEELIFTCPEGYWTFKELYPRIIGPLGVEVSSLTEKVGRAVADGALGLEREERRIAFQDPCRLSRYAGIVEEPRTIIDALGSRVEMERSGRLSACCGHSNWVNCDGYTREWQLQRLAEAEAVEADVLATACPKCLIHLSCAQRNLSSPIIRIEDIHVLAARSIRS